MSDHTLHIVPSDPHFRPADSQISVALAAAERFFPDADSIESLISDTIQFFDAGSNFEAAYCPACDTLLPLDWWQDAMDADYAESGFRLEPTRTPCCGRSLTLNELRYDWPQAFGRFDLTVQNPNVGDVAADVLEALEAALGTRLRVIHQHL